MKKGYISATDVNKYIYCNYSFYYEKKYGAKQIREIRKKNSDNLKSETKKIDGLNKNFTRGRNFHDRYKISITIQDVLIRLIFIFVLSMVLYYCYLYFIV